MKQLTPKILVVDDDPRLRELLVRYLTEQGVGIGDELEMLGRKPFDGPYEVRIGSARHDLGRGLARAMRVERLSPSG